MKISFWQDPQFYRKQTYWLLLALILNILFAYSPVLVIKAGATDWAEVLGGQVVALQAQAPVANLWWRKVLFPVVVVATLTIVIAIFSFANRKQQILAGRLAFLAQIACLTLPYLVSSYIQHTDSQPLSISLSYGLAFPVLNLLLIAFSIRLIQQDIKRLKSMDRLR